MYIISCQWISWNSIKYQLLSSTSPAYHSNQKFPTTTILLNSSFFCETLIMSHFRYYTSTHFGVSYYPDSIHNIVTYETVLFPSIYREKPEYIPIKTETLCRIPNIYLIHYLFFSRKTRVSDNR